MTNRKKRIERRIEALKEQLELHERKKEHAKQEGKLELADYYQREIKARKRTLEEAEHILNKQS